MEPTTVNYPNKKSSNFAADGKNIAEKVESQFDNVMSKVRDTDWKQQVQDIRVKADQAYDGTVDTVKAHPLLAVVGAAAVGFIAGSWLTRKH